ncbi:uncharacterized protein LOC111674020 [Orussus abietinus]|uniref:uncharacterized protein LOC111674020 n=1 Tax=Orussus abietinus TaxID=222816 RepID=UPI000C715F78|nr:uncharacterized protein LOC111674020 [Orussus abietinus]
MVRYCWEKGLKICCPLHTHSGRVASGKRLLGSFLMPSEQLVVLGLTLFSENKLNVEGIREIYNICHKAAKISSFSYNSLHNLWIAPKYQQLYEISDPALRDLRMRRIGKAQSAWKRTELDCREAETQSGK